MTTYRQTTPPSGLPVSVDEAKLHLRIPLEDDRHDVDLALKLAAAARHVEGISGRALVFRTLDAYLQDWPADGVVKLPWWPVDSITGVAYIDSAGAVQTLTVPTDIQLDLESQPSRIAPAYGTSWPTVRIGYKAITVTYVAGYGIDGEHVPEDLKSAVLLVLGDLWENREDTTAAAGLGVARFDAVRALLGPRVRWD